MATTNMKAIPAAAGFIAYCLDLKGKKERVQFVHSTFTDHKAELKMFAGKKYNGIDFRISFGPSDRKLTEKEFKEFVEEVTKGYLGERNYITICHNDTEHQHIHIISTFLDSNSKALNFAGRRNSAQEAVRRQEIVDNACKKFGFSVLPRAENSYNARDGIPGYEYKKERITKAERVGKLPEVQELRKLINNAKSISEIESHITRETVNSLTFTFKGRRIRLNSLNRKLKNRQDLENFIKTKEDRMNAKMEELLKAEKSFTSRIYDHADRLLKSGKSEQEVRNRIDMILRHKTESEDISERWDALKKMKNALAQEKEKWYDERKTEYEQQQKIRALGRILQSGNPIVALAAALIFLIAEIQKQRQLQQEREKGILSAQDILNPPSQEQDNYPNLAPSPGR
jgi:hypothetical protein